MAKELTARPVWLARAGVHGEDEEMALSEGLAIIGFRDVGDLNEFRTLEDLVATLQAADPEASIHRAANLARQLWAFREEMTVGDIVVLPRKTRPGQIALGRVQGPYEYRRLGEEMRHIRQVSWERTVPRSAFGQDLLYSFRAFMTVCRISRNDAEARVAAVLAGKADPGLVAEGKFPTDEEAPILDIAQAAHDQIIAYVRKHFTGHDMTRLVAAILEAEGFKGTVSPPGPDRGVDILAGRGPLGLDQPVLCVQVKATEELTGVTVFRALQGTMSSFRATQGLLVSWSGFTTEALREARQHAFSISLWDQSDLVQAIYRTYERLSPEIQSELPLKRIWTLVLEEQEG